MVSNSNSRLVSLNTNTWPFLVFVRWVSLQSSSRIPRLKACLTLEAWSSKLGWPFEGSTTLFDKMKPRSNRSRPTLQVVAHVDIDWPLKMSTNYVIRLILKTYCNSSSPPLADIVFFGFPLKFFKMRLLERDFHTLIKNLLFPFNRRDLTPIEWIDDTIRQNKFSIKSIYANLSIGCPRWHRLTLQDVDQLGHLPNPQSLLRGWITLLDKMKPRSNWSKPTLQAAVQNSN